MTWDPQHIPSQAGKTFVVTGGSAGIGYFVSEQLAAAGAHVVIAARNPSKIEAAVASITREVPGANVDSVILDLSSFASVRAAAKELAKLDRIDGLIENAGAIMPAKVRQETIDGNEVMFGTNHLGHFLLTALLYPTLKKTPGSRVVTMGSAATRLRKIDLSNLQSDHGKFVPFTAYAQSKHATQSFGFELDRRLRAAGIPVTALVAHPGSSIDAGSPVRPGVIEPSPAARFGAKMALVMGAGKHMGAWSVVRAATDPDAEGGQYWGPRGSLAGKPVIAKPNASSHAQELGSTLWAESEKLVGESFVI